MDEPVSRADDVERVHGWLEAAGAGRCVVGIVQGEPGGGKSSVAAALRARATDEGCTVLATSGRAADAELGFASLITLLRPHTGELDALAPDDAAALRAALALDYDDADAVRVDLGVFRVFAALAERATVLVLVDDADQLDRATAHALAFVLGRLDADPVCAVLFTSSAPADELASVAHEHCTLGPVDDPTLMAVATSAAPELSRDVAREVARRVAGNPLAARELATSLTPDERGGRVALPPVPRPSAAVRRGFEARLASLSERARRALVVVAADDTEQATTIAAALEHLGEPAGGLDEAEAAGLVARAGNRVRLAHPLLRAVAYHQVAPASRRAAHRALAAALDRPNDAAARAWQLAAAADGPDETAASALALAAVDAARRGGPASAARTLEQAAALTPDDELASRRLAAAAREWLAAGEADRAFDLAARVGGANDTDVVTVVVDVALDVRGAAGATQLLPAAGAANPRVDALRARVAWARGDLPGARGLAADVARAHDALAATFANVVLVLTADATDVEPPPAETETEPSAPATVEGAFAAACRELVADARVAVGLTTGAARTGRLGSARETRRAAANENLAGRPLAAVDLLRPLLDLDVSPRERDLVTLAIAESEMLLGRLRPDDEDVAAAIAAARRRDDSFLVAFGAWIVGRSRLGLAADDREATASLLGAARAYPVRYAADATLALVLAHQDDTAHEVAASVAAGRGGPIVALRAGRAEALARLDVDTLLRLRDDASRQGYAIEAVDAAVAAVVVARRTGRADGERDALAQAQRLLRATDARVHGSVLGGPAGAATRASTAAAGLKTKLSAAELRVAEAVTSGGTNRQVAEVLFLSVKTVDFHLQQIYRKLGVRSRTELAVLVSRDPELAGRTEP